MSKQQKDQPEKRPGQPDTERDAPRAGQQHQNEQSHQQHGSQPQTQKSPQPGSQQPGSQQPGSQQRSGQHRQDDSSQGNHKHDSGSAGSSHKPQEQQHDRSVEQGRNAEQRQKDKP